MHASAMPEGEELAKLGAIGATLAIHLSVRNLKHVQDILIPHYGGDCPAVIAYRVTWPDQQFIHGTLSNIKEKVRDSKISRTALILVGRVFDTQNFRDSAAGKTSGGEAAAHGAAAAGGQPPRAAVGARGASAG